MNGNTEILNYIFQNSQMGIDTINQLIEMVTDLNFRNHLQSELNGYENINYAAKEILNTNGSEEKSISGITKISTYMSINMKTLVDKTASHISEMLIQGSTMGIIDATKNIKKYSAADKNILELAEKLLNFEQANVEQLKKFL